MISDRLSSGFNRIVKEAGEPIRIRLFSETTGSVYDDDIELTFISDTWTSGIVLGLDNRDGSEDAILLQQGKLANYDQRLYIAGSVDFINIGSNYQTLIGLNGSPFQTETYTLIPDGGISWKVSQQKIYKKAYIRKIEDEKLYGLVFLGDISGNYVGDDGDNLIMVQ